MPAPSSPLVSLTDAAAAKVVELRSREGKSEAALRLFVKSGGCSGYSYGLAFDDRIAEDDRLETHEVVDAGHVAAETTAPGAGEVGAAHICLTASA